MDDYLSEIANDMLARHRAAIVEIFMRNPCCTEEEIEASIHLWGLSMRDFDRQWSTMGISCQLVEFKGSKLHKGGEECFTTNAFVYYVPKGWTCE